MKLGFMRAFNWWGRNFMLCHETPSRFYKQKQALAPVCPALAAINSGEFTLPFMRCGRYGVARIATLDA
jgi:hypothetical protein